MSEEAGKATEGQEPTTPSTPQVGQTATEASPQAGKAGLSADEQAEALKKARDEAASRRIENKRLAEELAAYKAREEAEATAKLTEIEKAATAQEALTKKLAEYEATLAAEKAARQALALKTAVMEAAPKAGIAHAAAAVKLLDTSTLTLGDDGTPTNLDTALKDLLKTYPFLGAGPVISATNPSREGTKPGQTDEAREREIRRKVYGEPMDMFNPARARAMGGGVVDRQEP